MLIAVILATFFFASTTTTQAQTKEETIEWLKENLKFGPTEYSEFDGFMIDYIDECKLTLLLRRKRMFHFFSMPLNGLKINYNGELEFASKDINWTNEKTSQESKLSKSTFFKIEGGSYDEYREKFKHLAGFCNK